MTKLLICSCVNQYQDRKYGPSKRVHNERVKDQKHKGWTCTACGKKNEV